MDTFSQKKRSEIMSRVRSKNTGPEKELCKALWLAGFRYRKHYGPFKIDIAFPGKKVAVFIDGCFWHGCPAHGRLPATNVKYWGPKLERNKKRDIERNVLLQEDGWTVIRVWSHELKHLESVLQDISNILNSK